MTSMNFRHTYTSSEDVVERCVRRRSAYNTVNKNLVKPNESAEFARSQLLQRKCLGGTTIFITLEEEALLNAGTNTNTGTNTNSTSNSASGLNYIEKCPFVYRRQTVLPLTNKF